MYVLLISADQTAKKRRRWRGKSRWGDTEDVEKDAVLSGLPTTLPAGLSREQEEQYLREHSVFFLYGKAVLCTPCTIKIKKRAPLSLTITLQLIFTTCAI